ncbi:MAG TPA: PQQ-dependent sugar dehydrogenase, partial [Blastocatellia bacterium]|nr:PQQ-dependent sugar dehydrogenase [Blastocatellia bacterium]
GTAGADAELVEVVLEPVLAGLSSPVYVTNAHDGSKRLFIVEQSGRIKVLQPGASTPTVFLDIRSRIVSGGEQGLLGLAFHPQFSTNRRFFVDYTRQPDGATVIAEYSASPSDSNVASNSETVLLVIPQPFANHNGGMVEFGPDQFLYIGMGDGGSANDPGNRAQNTNELLGKILRIDVDHADGSVPYSSPSDNPFFGATPGRDEIYAYGMRNPWRFSFDRATGQLYVGDVGQGNWEEVDIVTQGGNYGWRVTEGNHCNPSFNGGACTPIGIPPVAEYGHSGGRCSITGGYVYRGSQSSLPVGAYLYADYCTGELFILNGGTASLLLDTSMNISSFGEDEAGEIYVVGLEGTINRITNPNPPPPPTDPVIQSAGLVRHSTQEPFEPIRVKSNGKKFDIQVFGSHFVSDSRIFISGRSLKTTFHDGSFLTGRMRRDMLAQPGAVVVQIVNLDFKHSDVFILQVVPNE